MVKSNFMCFGFRGGQISPLMHVALYWLWFMQIVNMSAHHIQESQPQFENQIMAWVYVRGITCSTMYQKTPFC